MTPEELKAIRERCRRIRTIDNFDCVYSETYLADVESTLDTLTRLQRDYSDLRNELCLACGKYKEAHLGRCNGCRWGENDG